METDSQTRSSVSEANAQIRSRLRQALEEIAIYRRTSQRGLARALGISQPGLNAILSGKTKTPSEKTLRALESVLGIRREWLQTGVGGTFLQYPEHQVTERGITFYRFDFGHVFAATIEGWRRILTFEMEFGRKYSGREDPWYDLAWDARKWNDLPFRLNSIPLQFGPGSSLPFFLFCLGPELPMRFMLVRNVGHLLEFQVSKRERVFEVAAILDSEFKPIQYFEHQYRLSHGLALSNKEYIAISTGPYPKER